MKRKHNHHIPHQQQQRRKYYHHHHQATLAQYGGLEQIRNCKDFRPPPMCATAAAKTLTRPVRRSPTDQVHRQLTRTRRSESSAHRQDQQQQTDALCFTRLVLVSPAATTCHTHPAKLVLVLKHLLLSGASPSATTGRDPEPPSRPGPKKTPTQPQLPPTPPPPLPQAHQRWPPMPPPP